MVLKNSKKVNSSVRSVTRSTTTSTPSATSATRGSADRKELPAAGSSTVASPVSLEIHAHCENCINVSTCKDSSCPIVPCDCGHKLHQCKLQDHALLCREANFKVREALLPRACRSYRRQGLASNKPVLTWTSPQQATPANSMSSPSHLGTSCASQDYLPTSTPPTSPLDLSSPFHTNTNTSCAGKRFLLDDAEMDVLEALTKDNPDLLTHGVNLDMEETITCSPEDETPPGLQDFQDLMSPSSEQVEPASKRGSIPSVEIFCVESEETQRRTDSLVELGENIVAEAVQLAKATLEDMLELRRERALGGERSASVSGKALEQKQTSELLNSIMKTPKPATRYSLAGDEGDSPSDEPENDEPDSEQLLDDASLSQHGPDEPETISDESSSCLEPVRIQATKSPTLEFIPNLPDDPDEKHMLVSHVVRPDHIGKDHPRLHYQDNGAGGGGGSGNDDDSQNSDTESHSPSPFDRYHCTGTVVRKVKNVTTTTVAKMTAGSGGAPAPANKKNSYVAIAENGLGRDGAYKETAVTGVSLSSLKQSYVQNACNGGGPASLPPERTLRARENIPAINIEQLKNTYNNLGHSGSMKPQSPEDLVPVNINALRENFSRQQSIHAAREPSPVEEVKLSVDKKKVQSQFSIDDGDADSKCKRCQKTVYPAERVRAEKAQYHKQCFRCKECNKTLSAESYNSHEGELYCANHFKQLFQPKANFDSDSGPRGQDLLLGCDDLDHGGKQRKHEMIIRENEPMHLGPDVVRCDTRSNMEDLEGLNLNLGSLKSRFENQQQKSDGEIKKSASVADRSALSRSASVLKRLEKYQSVASGEAKADTSDEEDEEKMEKVDLSKKIEVCKEMNELKNKWESGKVSKDHREAGKDELASLRKKICVGRSESMKVVYEKAVHDANAADSKKTSAADNAAVSHVFATNLKKKFETGEVIKEQEAERLENVKNEKEDDLSVCQDTGIAHQAKNMFQQLDKEITSRPQPHAPLTRSSSESRWNRTTSEADKNIEIVKASDPGHKDHIEVETTALTERFKFFQNFKEEPASKKDFRMTPPRELEKENSPAPACERDPDVVVGSSVIDDIPKVDTATKMRQKFQELIEAPPEKAHPSAETLRPRALKRMTPPRETFEGNVIENTPVVDPSVIKCSYKVDDDIQVEADKTKSMKARFENWSDVEQRKNSVNVDDDCLPVDNITRNMRAMFETNRNQGLQTNGQTAERNKLKVNRFVFGALEREVCAMCQEKVFPMERREASGLVMHTKCFKCTHCNINLRLDGYSQTGGKLYCEAHYQQLFKVKGNYDEGFGREKWSRTPSPSTQDTPPLNLPPTNSNHTVIA